MSRRHPLNETRDVEQIKEHFQHIHPESFPLSPLRVVKAPTNGDQGSQTSAKTDSTVEPKQNEPFDFANALRKTLQRQEVAKYQTQHRELGVVFRKLRVVGLRAATSYAPTLSSTFNPLNIVEAIQNARHPPVRDILGGFEGVIKPGEMLLVLGRPGSGCTTFLKMTANRREEYHAIDGEIYYDSVSPDDLRRHYRGDVQYCAEDDIHFGPLTVEQTLKFAATTRAPRNRAVESCDEYANQVTDMLMTVFGLRHARKTLVGDQWIRGVSGGEKKRVSLAETMTARSCIGAWDNSTRGLDASTALEFVQALRTTTDTLRTTTIASLYQAGELIYKHFDKVCVIYEGKMAYFGPADRARQYFVDMGYDPVNRQTTADFLVAVTDPNGRVARPGHICPPQTATEFAEYFKNSDLGRLNREKVQEYVSEFVGKPDRAEAYKQSAREESAKMSRKGSPYLLSIPEQIRAVVIRGVQISRGNLIVPGLVLFSYIFQALIMGSIFYNVQDNTAAFFSRGGALFFALIWTALSSISEIPALFVHRPVVLRHQHGALYHPFTEAIALTIVDAPFTLVISLIFSVVFYFLVGLQQTADQFFIFFLFTFTMAITMKGFHRATAALFVQDTMALSFSGTAVLAIGIYTGYAIPKSTMVGAVRWITYINPMRYGFEAVMENEFRTLQGTCSSLIPQGPGYENVSIDNQVCTAIGSLPGQSFVDGHRFLSLSYGFSSTNIWKNYGILVAFGIGMITALLVFTEFMTSTYHESTTILFRRGYKNLRTLVDEECGKGNEKPQPESSKQLKDGVAEPRTPMSDLFSWRHLNYSIPIPGEEDRQLLGDVSGYVAPGKLTALMGESGAGKTTLLNVLAQRTSTGVTTGDIFVNGQPLPQDFRAQTGYCQQMDTHIPQCTVREALLFSAKLRQPSSVPDAEKEAYVEQCLIMCGLQDYAEATIGSLSTEQRKRTTIGVELAAKPELLLFLDEPTSGLDSQSAWAIMLVLRSLADNGQAILCTIHQPSAELFQVFDRLLLLQKGGQTVYFGDLGPNSTTLINYFEKNGARVCEPDENPAEYMLDIIGAGATATTERDWHTVWQRSQEANQLQVEIEGIHNEGRSRPAVETTLTSEFATPWFYQTWELVKRGNIAYWRNPTYLMAKFLLNIGGGLFLGVTFFQSSNSQQGTQNKLFSLFMVTILSFPISNQLQVPYIDQRTIYEIRERPSRIYSWTAFITAHLLVETPWNIIGSFFLFVCWYWTVGFSTDRAGYTYLVLGIVYPIYYSTIAIGIAVLAPTAQVAAILFNTLFTFVVAFDGVLQPYRQLHFWKWMYRLSPYTYLLEGLLGQALGHQLIECSAVEYVELNPPHGMSCGQYFNGFISFSGGYLTNPDATSACQFCSTSTTDEFLASDFNVYSSHAWRNFGLMIVYIVFNVVVVYSFTYLFRIRTGSLFFRFSKKNQSKV